jgi:hypothetical protein
MFSSCINECGVIVFILPRPQKIVVKRISLRSVKRELLFEVRIVQMFLKLCYPNEFNSLSEASAILRQFFCSLDLLLLFHQGKRRKKVFFPQRSGSFSNYFSVQLSFPRLFFEKKSRELFFSSRQKNIKESFPSPRQPRSIP